MNRKQLSLLLLGAALAISATPLSDARGITYPGHSNLRALASRGDSHRPPLVPPGDLLVGKRSGRPIVLERSGRPVRREPRFAHNGAQGVELAPDRRHAFVSVRTGERPERLYEVDLATGEKRRVASAISPALSPDRTRLAYVATDLRGDIVYRTTLVVRELRTGRTRSIPFGPNTPFGTPPELVINWSPDGRRLAVFDGSRIRLVDVANASAVPSQPSLPRASTSLAPVFLNTHTRRSRRLLHRPPASRRGRSPFGGS